MPKDASMTAQNTILVSTQPPRSLKSSTMNLLGWALVLAVLAWS